MKIRILSFALIGVLVAVEGMAQSGGGSPRAGVVRDFGGNLYGTTSFGGDFGFGTIYKLAPNGAFTVLHSFSGGADGKYSSGGLLRDTNGDLYGTTASGGSFDVGVLYKLSSNGDYSVLKNFLGTDGATPHDPPVKDFFGNLYGTTAGGGNGTVYKLAPNGTYTVLYSPPDSTAGEFLYAGVIRDTAGNLYGTAYSGGKGCGTIYKVAANGASTVLYSFNGPDGCFPGEGTLYRDQDGALWGTTWSGGAYDLGTVYKLSPSGVLTVVHSFEGGVDGKIPWVGVTGDSNGNIYGVTSYGGTGTMGTLFRISTTGAYTILHNFYGSDGQVPFGEVTVDRAGNLYGTTAYGGNVSSLGVVYKYSQANNTFSVLHSF